MTDQATDLARALGLPADTANTASRTLRDAAGLWPDDGELAGLTELVDLLLALASPFPPEEAAKAVEIFRPLPLTSQQVRFLDPATGEVSVMMLIADQPNTLEECCCAPTLGPMIEQMAGWSDCPGPGLITPLELCIGGGEGTYSGQIDVFEVPHKGAPAKCAMGIFYGADSGSDRPDDAPPARLDRTSRLPATVFPILRRLAEKSGSALVQAALWPRDDRQGM